jgi:hypothetical protein
VTISGNPGCVEVNQKSSWKESCGRSVEFPQSQARASEVIPTQVFSCFHIDRPDFILFHSPTLFVLGALVRCTK